MEAEDKTADSTRCLVHRSRRLWLWFVGGFLLVFVGMLFLVTMTTLHPSGQYVLLCPLWRYYVIGLSRLFGPATLGPGSGSSSDLIVVLVKTGFFHLLLSVAGGGVAVAVGWCVHSLCKTTRECS